jgi:hypothetical protein
VLFIIPDGFRGGFALEVDRERGQEIPMHLKKLVIRVSKDGLIKVKHEDFIDRFLDTARFECGEVVWNALRWDKVPPADTICFFTCGTEIEYKDGVHVSKARYWWFVGTKDEEQRWRTKLPYVLGRVHKDDSK